MMKHGEQIGELAAALAKAQAAMKGALADSSNPHFKSRYADLESVRCACIPALTANGVAVVQGLSDGKCITRLVHSSGQWIETEVPLIIGKNDMQSVGSAITYARRYGLAAAVCLSQTDDDANAAGEAPRAMNSAPARAVAAVGHAPKAAPAAKHEPFVDETKGATITPGPQYQDNDTCKGLLARELHFCGITPKLENYAIIAREVHGLCIGKPQYDMSATVATWVKTKGFKKESR